MKSKEHFSGEIVSDFHEPIEIQKRKVEQCVDQCREYISDNIKLADSETLEILSKSLVYEPYLSINDISEIIDGESEYEGMMTVPVDAIIGSVSLAFKHWNDEYAGREGRIVEIAQELIEGTEESIDHVFHIQDHNQAIQLIRIFGPDGDIFIVVDGTHRVAGAKLVQLPEIPAVVEEVKEKKEYRTTDTFLVSQWKKRIAAGFIIGDIEERIDSSGEKTYVFLIQEQIFSWAALPHDKLVEVNQVYSKVYPQALKEVKSLITDEIIPENILVDHFNLEMYLR